MMVSLLFLRGISIFATYIMKNSQTKAEIIQE
ncbi:hypothetical protein ABID52_000236 [Fictibacillus halophilus]|uniref:Uncharacterized protein n=1 Tax=Fictibacillus halophilus TaxID=1610490 RepID=A0ABV2LDJ2_9BACL